MKVLVLILLVGGLMLSSCGGSSSKNNANVKEVNPADTIYLGDLREKFAMIVFSLNSGTGFDVDGLSVSLGSNRIGSSRERTDKRIL